MRLTSAIFAHCSSSVSLLQSRSWQSHTAETDTGSRAARTLPPRGCARRWRPRSLCRLGGYQAQHDLLAGSDVLERLKAAGARRVELQIERIDILMCEQIRSDRVVAAFKSVGGVVVAAAHVRVDDQIVGLALDGGVVERHAQLAYLLQVDRLMPVLATKSVSQ